VQQLREKKSKKSRDESYVGLPCAQCLKTVGSVEEELTLVDVLRCADLSVQRVTAKSKRKAIYKTNNCYRRHKYYDSLVRTAEQTLLPYNQSQNVFNDSRKKKKNTNSV
jgi:hypothetical protein